MMPIKALVGLTVLAAIVIGLALPGPSLGHRPQPHSRLQTLDLRSF